MKFNTNHIIRIFWVLAVALLTRCTPIDHHYSDYLDNAEKAYPGRVDSLVFLPGNNRGGIRSLISTDARVKRMRITWGQDGSFETDILPEDIAGYKDVIIPEIEEGVYTFDVRTLDKDGNQSMRSEIFGRVYGETYTADLNNRIIESITKKSDSIVVNWFAESTSDTTLLGTVVSYETETGGQQEIFAAAATDSTVLPKYKTGTTFNYNTLYKPGSMAIDTFYAASRIIDPADYITPERTLYDRENWSIAGVSAEETRGDRLAVKVLDGDVGTFWIANWSGDSGPIPTYPDHWLTVDMGEVRNVDGFFFAQKNGDRKIREMEIHISDDNESWENLGLFGLADINREYQYLDLDARKTFRYFKIVPTAGHDSQQQPGLAEAGTYYY
ncbi:F5/8 type C domain-containing protein [Sinomicrobium oceani]|uniref:F5/8 type C domain-containing protein n=1 Tax=Sinomicrobium oceani TaxID=1150368 RepID=A0A1K1PSD7_9FLAO|nr:DUF4998 domain-containing protein [Sinomicrobium oceani]SFW50543.1 F5/8 type C domain-containing protein [Sinomicrobium oceani]